MTAHAFTALLAIARREYAGFFRVPLGWIVGALFLLLSGFVFARFALIPGAPATMRDFFGLWWRVLIIITPAISMRLLSEEHRSGTIDTLMASPVSELAIVAGKYLGAVAFIATLLAPTLLYVAVLLALAPVDLGPIAAGYLGVLLLAMLQLAVGTLFSAMTASQTLAFLATLFALVGAELCANYASSLAPRPLDEMLLAFSTDLRIADFAKGVIDTGHVAFFVVLSGWLVALAALLLRARRWR
jgi:ABC-2 type transport system permease protein